MCFIFREMAKRDPLNETIEGPETMKELTMNLRIELDDGIENSMAREDRNVGFDIPAPLPRQSARARPFRVMLESA
jgi:hypothetical protein